MVFCKTNVPPSTTSNLHRWYRFILGCFELLCYIAFGWFQRQHQTDVTKRDIARPTVSLVCATVSTSRSLRAAFTTWHANAPDEVLIVTDADSHASVTDALSDLSADQVQILQCPKTNKRVQLCEGIKNTVGAIVVIVDDDTVWTPHVLSRLLEPFQTDSSIGAVFPEVQFRPAGNYFNLWESLSAFRLSGDAIDIRTSMLVDGGVFCASGTTAAYIGRMLRDPKFLEKFPTELWMGRVLNAGDDQSLTLWLAEHNWKCRVIPDQGPLGFCVMTTPRSTWRHLAQLARWSRSDWQACIKATLISSAMWR